MREIIDGNVWRDDKGYHVHGYIGGPVWLWEDGVEVGTMFEGPKQPGYDFASELLREVAQERSRRLLEYHLNRERGTSL